MTTQTDGRAQKTRTTFRMECGVAIKIQAPPEKIWSLLTTAPEFPKWNSRVESVEGKIAAGEKIAVKVPSAPGRTFKLKVSELEAEKRMVWRDGMAPMFQGVRTFELAGQSDGTTEFRMVEVFTGLMLPMIAG